MHAKRNLILQQKCNDSWRCQQAKDVFSELIKRVTIVRVLRSVSHPVCTA